MSTEFRGLLIDALPRMRAYAFMLTRDRPQADDLVQEMCFRALRAQEQFIMGTNFNAWLYRILRNEYVSTIRRRKKTTQLDDTSEHHFAREGNQETHTLTREVLQAMAHLPLGQREVLTMVCGEGMSYSEVAEAVGCTVGTVKSRLWRAREAMQRHLLGDDEAPRVAQKSRREAVVAAEEHASL